MDKKVKIIIELKEIGLEEKVEFNTEKRFGEECSNRLFH